MKTIDTSQTASAIADDNATSAVTNRDTDHDCGIALPNLDTVDGIVWNDIAVYVAG